MAERLRGLVPPEILIRKNDAERRPIK
jgi:hypothetical protein